MEIISNLLYPMPSEGHCSTVSILGHWQAISVLRTLDQLKQAYFWPGMRKYVTVWYQQCADCFCGRRPSSKPHGKLHKVVVGEPLDIVAVDILSGLPISKDGYKYVCVLTDDFSKWTETYPLKDAEAPTCMRATYNHFFSRFGLPRQIHSDQR